MSRYESRHDVPGYSEFNDVITPSEQTAEDAERESLINGFFYTFNDMSESAQKIIADDVMQENVMEIYRSMDNEAAVKIIAHNIGIQKQYADNYTAYNIINKAARQYIDGCIRIGNIWWEIN